MREILFRGKRIDNGEWVEGSLLHLFAAAMNWDGSRNSKKEHIYFIIDTGDINHAVIHETVGQYTGIKDKDGKRIYEGDILAYQTPKAVNGITRNVRKTGAVYFYDGMFAVTGSTFCHFDRAEIIGNIYDNPELLEG